MIAARLIRLTILLIIPLTAFSADRSVEVPNPSFEEGDLLPAGWQPRTSQTEAVFIWDREQARTGQRSLYMRNYGPRWAIWRSEPIAVKENTPYRLTVWARILFDSPVSSSRLYLRVRSGRWTAVEHVTSRQHDEWQPYSLDFTTGEGIESLNIELSNLGGQGTEVWLDDVELVERSTAEE